MFTHRIHKTFTLIEMLIVIAIIGILAAMLMPALQSAMDEARKVNCSNNQRGMSQAFYMYSADNSGFFPPATMQYLSEWHFKNGWEKYFTNLCGVYVGFPNWYQQKYGDSATIQNQLRTTVFTCPANPAPEKKSDFGLFKTGYGYNVRLSLKARNSNSWPTMASGTALATSLKNPSKIVHTSDGYRTWSLGSKGLPVEKVGVQEGNIIDTTRHTSGANLLFADGHVQWYEGMSIALNFDRAYITSE